MLLQTLDAVRAQWEGKDEELLALISKWAEQLRPNLGFEHTLSRDVTALSRYLHTHGSTEDIGPIARGGLLYLILANKTEKAKLGEFEFLDDAFICSYALHEIRLRLGDTATYSPPRLTPSEQDKAESLFVSFVENPLLPDERLVEEAKAFGIGIASAAYSSLFWRLRNNIEFLANTLLNSDLDEEHKDYARAALSYVCFQEDAIDDSLGMIGYLDDNFIAQLAVDLIDPTREPWLEILDATIGIWPFLTQVLVEWEGSPQSLSEYMIINSALSCPELRERNTRPTILSVPIVGPVPFLIGTVATLGLIQGIGQHEVREDSFSAGQKVLVDNTVVAEFTGFKTFRDCKMFGLKQYSMQHGDNSPSTHYWPVSDLQRLIPTDPSRSTRGKLTHDLSKSDVQLPALEYLFNASKTVGLSSVKKHMLVVTPILSAREIAKNLNLFSHALKDVFPMGHLTTDGEIERWSSRFGQQEPLLLFASDLDEACAFAEQDPDQNNLVIVDATGRNANKTASLKRLQQFKIPTLIVSPERTVDALEFAMDGSVALWEWNDGDFSSLLWPDPVIDAENNPIANYERRLRSRQHSAVQVETLSLPVAEQAFQVMRDLQGMARRRGENCPTELENLIGLTFRTLTLLLRSAVPITRDTLLAKRIESYFQELNDTSQNPHYMAEDERRAARKADESLRELLGSLQVQNQKSEYVSEVLSGNPDLWIICPDSRLRVDLEQTYAPRGAHIAGSCDDESELPCILVPGWFRKDRMNPLLIPPVSNPLHLVLYNLEHQWYADFLRAHQKSRSIRSDRSSRATLFPNVDGWKKPASIPKEPANEDAKSGLDVGEEINQTTWSNLRRHVYKSAESDGTETEIPARLVIFEGGARALLTESYKANVVTHLLDSSAGDFDNKADIRQRSISDLCVGDALLFRRGADSDVIRAAADKLLPPGIRATSSLWRKALLEYTEQEALTPEELWQRLRKAGCPLHRQTIRSWLVSDSIIAPQKYERDVSVIAKLTANKTLTQHMDDVLIAISAVRSAHLSASHQLARQVVARAVSILKEERQQATLVEVEANVLIVRVAEVDAESSLVAMSWTNRLLEDDQ